MQREEVRVERYFAPVRKTDGCFVRRREPRRLTLAYGPLRLCRYWGRHRWLVCRLGNSRKVQDPVRICILEKEDGWARHQTGRNSGVIHSGIYYKPGSLKAAFCQNGNRRIVEFCDTYGIRYEVCGKVIVAVEASELPGLEALYERGLANGLVAEKLTASEVREIEPYVSSLAGIRVPSTGIVDFRGICLKLADLIAERGGELRLSTRVKAIRTGSSECVLDTSTNPLAARCVVNCAGLQSDRVARLAGVKVSARIIPFRGEYYELRPERRYLVRNLIYPVPDPNFPFLGVHFTRMIDGSVHAGPNAVLSLKREGYHRTSFDCARFFRDRIVSRVLATRRQACKGRLRRSIPLVQQASVCPKFTETNTRSERK